nr:MULTISPECIES: ferredoxin [Streptomyces]
MTVSADRDLCCASGNCVLLAPAVFDQSEADGQVVVLDPQPPVELWPAVREAVEVCPVVAITVREAARVQE